MRLNTSIQIASVEVSKHGQNVMLYLGETSGSIVMSADEAADLYSKIGAVLPAHSMEPVDRLLRALLRQFAAAAQVNAAQNTFDCQSATGVLTAANFELAQAITALEIQRAPAKAA